MLGILIGAPFLLGYMAEFLNPERVWTCLHYSVIAAVCAVLVFGAAGTSRLAQTAFANPVVSWLGKISYSLYLWHWPALEATKALGVFESLGPPAATVVGVVAALVIAALSFRWIESPFLRDHRELQTGRN